MEQLTERCGDGW